MSIAPGLALLALSAAYAGTSNPPVNQDSAIIVEFQKRVADYLQLRKETESKMTTLKPTGSVEKITDHEAELTRRIREARAGAKQGDIFTPPVAAEIKRLVAIAMRPDGKNIKSSLRHAEPVALHLKVNESYPLRIPRQSTPPSLLENLPMLPPEIEYRLSGGDLVLLDAKANLVIDFIPSVLPS